MRYYNTELKSVLEKYGQIDEELTLHQKHLSKQKIDKLYDIEYGEQGKIVDIGGTPMSKKANKAYTVSKKEAERMKKAKIDPKTAKKIKKNSDTFRKNNGKKKKKGIITAAIALIMAGVMTISGFLIAGKLKKKNNGNIMPSTTSSQNLDKLGTGSLDSLGEELPKTDKKASEYTKVSGDFNIEDVVRGADGLLYDSQESADNASKAGSTVIDTQGGSLVVGNDGNVYTQEEGYEIQDENGNVIESGNGTPSDMEEGIPYVECPCNYYDDEGNLVHSKGEFITPEELELCKQYYHTEKPKTGEYEEITEEYIYYDEESATTGSNEKTEESESEVQEEQIDVQEETQSQATSNSDGTYSAYGQTYSSYEDYQQYIIDGGEGYGEIDGVIQPIGDYEIETQYTK